MDFFEHQDKARRKTFWLVAYFVLAVVFIILAVYLVLAGLLFYAEGKQAKRASSLWKPELFAAVSVGTLVVIAAGSLYKTVQLSGGGEAVARSLGGRPVHANTTVLAERVLLNVVEEMALASGTPVPPVYLLDQESGINAFAAGTSPQNAVIGVTRGALQTLKRDELLGVIAHEFSHILNGDMRLNLRLIGVLHGILLIAMIGYVLLRTGSSSSYFSSSSKKGGNPLPLVGLCLYLVGYIGVFFGHLIKSAVSRQREFLADASAVQFTRLPSGIGGALKKLGGYGSGSKLQSPNAEEASHMFFGNGLAASFLQMLSTHPPLEERIRRIEPDFKGPFPTVERVEYTPHDVHDPHAFAQQRGLAAQGMHAQAVAGSQAMGFQPAAAVAQIGEPRAEHLDYAAALISSLPPELSSDVRDPLGAIATIYALLLDDDEPDVRQAQVEYLAQHSDPRAAQETQRMAPFVARLRAEARLPLVALALPALHDLSAKQLVAFHADVAFLIRADKNISLFEYAVHRLVLKRLVPRLERQPQHAKHARLAVLVPACRQLLSALAHAGSSDEASVAGAFTKGMKRLFGEEGQVGLLPHDKCGLPVVDAALDRLAGAAPNAKKRILEACAECIAADGHITVEEGELLRVISDALDCPMPPLVGMANT